MERRFILFIYQGNYPGGGMNDFDDSFIDLQSALDRAEEYICGDVDIAFWTGEDLEYILFRGRGYHHQPECIRGVFYDTGWVWVRE